MKTYSKRELESIHSNRKAVLDKYYKGFDGILYKGLANGTIMRYHLNSITRKESEWSADTEIYDQNLILISSDKIYTNSNQRQYKICDGSKTWKQLDYFPDVNSKVDPINESISLINAQIAALSSVYQPLDSDLTAIAALTTTAYGRGLLTLLDAAALRLSAGLNLNIIAYNNLSVTHTGNVAQTVVRSFQIPTTEINENSVIEILAQFGSSSGAFTKTLRVYLNTSNTLVGATLIGTQQLSAAQFYGGFRRQIVNKNSINTNRIIPTTTVQVTDISNLTVNMANLNWNFSGTTWLIATIQLGGAAASATLENIQVKLSKP